MVGTHVFDHTANTITSTAGTAGAPITFNDLWVADKAGTQELVHARAITGADANPVAVNHAERPTDYYVLGLADIYITVTNFSANGTIQIVGTEQYGAAQTEDIAFTGNGVYNSTKYWRTITTTQVTVFANNFTYTLTQGQWGVVWRSGYSYAPVYPQYTIDAQLKIGDSSTVTYFTDTMKQVTWGDMMQVSPALRVTSAAVCTFGVLEDLTTKRTSRGCSLIINYQGYASDWFLVDVGGTLYVYSGQISTPAPGNHHYLQSNGTFRLWNASLTNNIALFYSGFNIYNVIQNKIPNGALGSRLIGTFDKWIGTDILTGVYVAWNDAAITLSNMVLSGNTYVLEVAQQTNPTYLVNCIASTWAFLWGGGVNANYKAYRQYTFDLKITDKVGTAISGATVTLKDNAGTTIFSVATDAAGNIAQQTVSRGYYNQANGNTLQDYGPFDLTISKAGYMNYTHNDIVLDEPIDWRCYLRTQLSGNATVGNVMLGQTFYKDDADSKLTGTLALTGNADVTDVLAPKTFYKDDPLTQLTGTLVPATGGGGTGRTVTVIKKDPELVRIIRDYVKEKNGST